MDSLQERLFRLRYQAGYVLRDVLQDEMLTDIPKYVGVNLYLCQDDVKNVRVYVPDECVFSVHVDSDEPMVDLVLSELQYNVFYEIYGVAKQRMVSRDVICNWYYRSKISVSETYYDLMYVPMTALGFLNTQMDYRAVTWQSTAIQPGQIVNMMVKASDILYIPRYQKIAENLYMEDSGFENYVNINLSEDVYRVEYKSADTGWRMKVEFVSKYLVVQDYLKSLRARFHQKSVDEWLEYLMYLDETLD